MLILLSHVHPVGQEVPYRAYLHIRVTYYARLMSTFFNPSLDWPDTSDQIQISGRGIAIKEFTYVV
jgi:hypothetical protein